MKKKSKIKVVGTEIAIVSSDNDDFISLTDMIKAKDGDFFISDWLRNRNTVEFLGIWETVNNPNFNYGEFAIIRTYAGLNSYKISVKEWVEKTNAIGLRASAGRYGGTFAHQDIAFEFGMWISPEFKVYLIREYKRLKNEENERLSLEWNLSRTLSKLNYHIHTGAISEMMPPDLSQSGRSLVYASEADMLNLALFGKTAKMWRKDNPEKSGNIRDYAAIEQLIVLTNLESLNAVLIKQGILQSERLNILNKTAIDQMQVLLNLNAKKRLSNEIKGNIK